jgi:hypothetical protein
MKTFWTPKRDKRLLALWQAGRSATEIADTLRCSRSAVLGRLYRQRHLAELIAHPELAKPKKRKRKRRPLGSDWQRALDRSAARAEKDLAKEDAAIKALAKALKAGVKRSEAIARANRAGASWRRLGEFFDRTPQWAYSYAKVWDRRFEIARENKERKVARKARQRELIADMAKAVKRGMPEEQAMARAHRAGATWPNIGAHFGIAQQTAHYRARIWREEARGVRTFKRRK